MGNKESRGVGHGEGGTSHVSYCSIDVLAESIRVALLTAAWVTLIGRSRMPTGHSPCLLGHTWGGVKDWRYIVDYQSLLGIRRDRIG